MANRNFQRKREARQQNLRFLITSEGKVTEPEYLDIVKAHRRIRSADIRILPPPPTSPKEIVAKACDLKRQARRDDPYDAVWCIFDVEPQVGQKARPGLADAMQMASANGISVALSNPCFELWILLHSEDCQSLVYSSKVQQRCAELELVTGKHLCNPDQILSNCQAACQRAKDLDSMHQRNGNHKREDQNPSTSMSKLLEAIDRAFPPVS